MIARAQVHALLALAEAYVAGATMRPEDRDEWDRVTERLEPGELGEPGTGRAAMRRFMREHPLSPSDYVQRSSGCAETSDGAHAGDWYDSGRCGACGLLGPQLADGPDPDRPETWIFGEPPETTGWHNVPDPGESQP